MLREHDHDPEDCRALSEVLSRIGDRWTILVIGILAGGPQRFNEMRRSIEGITQRMLTLTLRGLERDGLVVRRQTKTLPPTAEYVLSDRGTTLLEPLILLARWGREHREGIVQSRIAFDLAKNAESEAQEKTRIHRLSGRVR